MSFVRKKNWMNLSTHLPRHDPVSFRTQDQNIKTGHYPQSAPKFTAVLGSTVFLKSANPLDLRQKPTIRALFKAKSVDPKTFSPPSLKTRECDRPLHIYEK